MFHVLPGKAVASGHNWFLWKIGILSLFHLCWSSERVALVTEPSPPGRQVQSPISWSSRAALHQTPSQWNLMLLISAACLHVVINESLQLIISNATLQPGLQGWEESVSFLFVFSVCVRVCVYFFQLQSFFSLSFIFSTILTKNCTTMR